MADQPVTPSDDGPAEAAKQPVTAETSISTSESVQMPPVETKSDQLEPPISNTDGAADEVVEEDPDVNDVAENVEDLALDEKEPKKKRKSRKKTGKKRRHITGFEGKSKLLNHTLSVRFRRADPCKENFCDPPVTPAEASEERQIYAPEIPFPQRIEECIQRYRQKRKVAVRNANIFDKYLFFGGIESSQRQFGGMDMDAIRESTTEEIRQMTATETVQNSEVGPKFYNPQYSEGWVVDFEGVVKGFLSRFIPECLTRIDPETDTREAGDLIHNFLNYVLHHDVCPEYTANIKAAQAICQIAPDELRATSELYAALPDSFNTAARFLFCDGGIFKTYEPEKPANETPKEKKASEWGGYDMRYNSEELDAHLQLIIFRFNLMDKIKDEKLKQTIYDTEPRDIQVVKTKTLAYRVVSTHRPSKRVKTHNEEILQKENLGGKVKPTGIVMLRPTIIDHAWSNVPRPEEFESKQDQPTEMFILDDHLLAKLVVGMKMQLVVCELNIGGFRFIKECQEVRTSFDTLLPQSLMVNWREPFLSERPAPSVFHPNVGHEDPAKMAQDDLEG
ncbi:argonaute siRNA chaperone complex subunit Arb1 [Apiospora phragmitis]|uniref:Argonaute siRNA chaperone complex subunit Arb1 n=1 Tax=Apiospora phragmitis TaxID=2905665 RepID=A0ABR1X7H6_9PEZI